jgi:hypothetical protein
VPQEVHLGRLCLLQHKPNNSWHILLHIIIDCPLSAARREQLRLVAQAVACVCMEGGAAGRQQRQRAGFWRSRTGLSLAAGNCGMERMLHRTNTQHCRSRQGRKRSRQSFVCTHPAAHRSRRPSPCLPSSQPGSLCSRAEQGSGLGFESTTSGRGLGPHMRPL